MAKKSAANKDDPYAGVPDREKKFVGKLLKEVDRAKSRDKGFVEKTLPRLRKLVSGVRSDDNSPGVRTNMVYATAATLLPLIYAKNPAIGVTLNESVSQDEYDQWRGFSKTAQSLLNRVFVQEGKLKNRAKSNVRSAMFTSVGWLKMIWQESLAGDPLMVRRENDMQDNLRQIEYLIACSKDKNTSEYEAKREELRNAIAAIRQSPEARIYKGFAIDRVKTEDMLILDHSVIDFHDYEKAKKLAHGIWMDDEEFKATFGFDAPPGTVEYGAPTSDSAETPDPKGKACYRRVYEIWDRTSNTVYTVGEGCHRYLRKPYVPQGMPERWHGFYALGFNLLEGRWRPLSDVELLEGLQKEYDDTRYLYAEARKEAIPVWVFRKSGNLTEEDIEKLVNRKARQWIGIEGNPQVPLKDDILAMPGQPIDPAAYDVTIIRNDMDMMVGLSDASRSNLVEAKTATEAEIMRQALLNRVSERQDTNEDLISEMAKAALEIMLQKLTLAEVREICGQDAVWPMRKDEYEQHQVKQRLDEMAGAQPAEQGPVMPPMSTDEIFNKVGVAVRAGSTGKPNLAKERENWAELMGVINETTTAVAELRLNGQFDLAEAKVELLRETLRRFDEALDVDMFIPPQEMGEDGKPVAMTNAMQQAAQTQEQLAKMQQELQVAQEQLQALEQEKVAMEQALAAAQRAEAAKVAEAEAKRAEAEAKTATAAADTEVKAIEAAAKAQAEAQAKADIERDRIEAEDRRHEAEMRRDEYRILVEAATSVVTSQVTAQMKAESGEEGGAAEGGEAKVDVSEMFTNIEKMMQRIDAMVSVMKGGKAQAD